MSPSDPLTLSRRRALQLVAGTTVAASLVPGRAPALPAEQRRFLFVFLEGGWAGTDLDPKFEQAALPRPGTLMDPGAVLGREGGLTWAGGPARAAIDRYFARWTPQTTLVRGVGVRSSCHHSAPRLALAGSLDPAAPLLPGWLAGGAGLLEQRELLPAVEELERGDARVALVRPRGDWDSHDDVSAATASTDRLFGELDSALARMAGRPGRSSSRLLDEVTTVVWSDMGRSPRINWRGGRDHWRTMSVLVAGGGLGRGVALGATTADGGPEPMDRATGLRDAQGTPLRLEDLWATLLGAAGRGAPPALEGANPLTALLGASAVV